MRGLRPFLRDAWLLSKPYFRSEERRGAWALLIAIVALNLLLVGMDVVLNFWNNAFYTALQDKQWDAFIGLLVWGRAEPGSLLRYMPGFCVIAAVYIAVAVYRTYLTQWLQMRWRQWMTGRFLDEWLADRAYYRIALLPQTTAGTENPDQRIADDIGAFIGDQTSSGVLGLGIDLLSNVVSLFSFLGILWGLSGALTVMGITIHGYMVWVALLYAAAGTVLTHLVGRKLAVLNFQQQHYEADFRFGLVRLRENTEGIALHGGEAEEKSVLQTRFSAVVGNWWEIMRRTKALNMLIYLYQQVAVIFPYVVASPRYFAGSMKLGGLTQTASAFGQVQSAMSWFVSSYQSLARWRATVERLASFHRAVEAARAASGEGARIERGGAPGLRNATLRLPDGRTLLDNTTLNFQPGTHSVITGASGSGKSTLFRLLAGIWPFAGGTVQQQAGQTLFLPQRPYLPLGTLRHALAYPANPAGFTDAALLAALHKAGLDHLQDALDQESAWAQRLSGGEQQRLAIARALLLRPDALFMDEATANLDEDSERTLLHTLRETLPGSTVVAISHRPDAQNATTILTLKNKTLHGR